MLVLPTLCAVVAPPARPLAPAARWIERNCIASDGAITVRPHGRRVSGYFGNLTALGLAESGESSHVVLRWMQWYIEHAAHASLRVPRDARLGSTGHILSTEAPDSIDAYGATFLMLALRSYRSESPSLRRYIRERRSAIERVALSVTAMQQRNGLTWASPEHHVAYAIDNAQVYRGLRDGARLVALAYHDRAFSHLLRVDADRVRAAMLGELWDSRQRSFRSYIGGKAYAKAPAANLHISYPDALAQATAVLYGVLEPHGERARALLARIRETLDPQTTVARTSEFRLIYLAALERAGQPPAPQAFTPPRLCSDAGWELMLASSPSRRGGALSHR